MAMIKNIIFVEKSIVSVIRLKKDSLEFLKKDGEIEFPLTVDFWDWWKRSLSYIEGNKVDICYIYDKDYDFLCEEFVQEVNVLNTVESSWNLGWIKEYFWKLKPTYFNISIMGLNEQEYSLGGDGSSTKFRKRFYTNLNFKEEQRSDFDNQGADSLNNYAPSVLIDEDYVSPIAEYFRDMIRRERG